MAGMKYSQAPAAAALDGTEILGITQDGNDVQTTTADIAALAVADVATTELIRDVIGTTVIGGIALTSTVDDPNNTVTLDVDLATGQDIWTGTSTVKAVTPDALFDAAAPQTLTYASPTTAVDMATGINFNLTLTGDTALGSPTNEKPGQSGRIRVTQDGTGGHGLTYGADWKHIGEEPAIDETADAINIFAYFVNAAGDIELSYLGVLA